MNVHALPNECLSLQGMLTVLSMVLTSFHFGQESQLICKLPSFIIQESLITVDSR